MSDHYDIAVIGAGTMGSMALWQLSKNPDLNVVGLERYGRAHPFGSYAGESRLFRTAVKEGALFVDLAKRARELWRELETASGRGIYVECGALSIGPPDCEPMQATRTVIEEHRLPHRKFDTDGLRAAYPQFSVDDGDEGILDEHAGALRSEVAVASAIDQAERSGATLHFNTDVLAIEPYEDHAQIRTSNGTITADTVIVTAGSWTSELLPDLKALIHVETIGLTWAMPDDIDQFVPERFPVFLRDRVLADGSLLHWFGTPTLDGYSIKVGTYPMRWDPVDVVEDVPDRFSADQLTLQGAQARSCIPDLGRDMVRASVHHDGYTSNRIPIIDSIANGRVIVAAGMCGNGFKFSPAYGQMLAELASEGQSSLWQDTFAVQAHTAHA